MSPENGDEAVLPAFHRRRRFHDQETDETCLFALPLPLILTSLHGIQLRTFALHPIIANCIDQHVWYLSIRRRGPTLVRAPAPSRLAMSRPRRARRSRALRRQQGGQVLAGRERARLGVRVVGGDDLALPVVAVAVELAGSHHPRNAGRARSSRATTSSGNAMSAWHLRNLQDEAFCINEDRIIPQLRISILLLQS